MLVEKKYFKKLFSFCIKITLFIVFAFLLSSCSTKKMKEEVYADNPIFPKTKFGSYNNEDLVWLVISEEENSYILMSEKILDTLPLDAKGDNSEWQRTSLYEYLNSDFVDSYFSKEEKESLGFINDAGNDVVTLPTLDNLQFLYGDMYYLASGFYNDKDYFEANVSMVASPAKLAVDNGIEVFDNNVYAEIMQVQVDERYDFATNCSAYWVLDRNESDGKSFYVTATGYVSETMPNTEYIGVRPIIRVMKG